MQKSSDDPVFVCCFCLPCAHFCQPGVCSPMTFQHLPSPSSCDPASTPCDPLKPHGTRRRRQRSVRRQRQKPRQKRQRRVRRRTRKRRRSVRRSLCGRSVPGSGVWVGGCLVKDRARMLSEAGLLRLQPGCWARRCCEGRSKGVSYGVIWAVMEAVARV